MKGQKQFADSLGETPTADTIYNNLSNKKR